MRSNPNRKRDDLESEGENVTFEQTEVQITEFDTIPEDEAGLGASLDDDDPSTISPRTGGEVGDEGQ